MVQGHGLSNGTGKALAAIRHYYVGLLKRDSRPVQ